MRGGGLRPAPRRRSRCPHPARRGDRALGLHAAEALRPGVLDVFDYAIRTAPTLLASLERLARYNRLVHDVAVFSITHVGPRTRVEHSIGSARQSPHAAEFTLAAIVVVSGQLLGAALEPLAVEFRHGAVEGAPLSSLERRFGRVPLFSRAVNALELERALLEQPLPAHDPALSRVLERHAEQLLAARPLRAESLSDRVRRALTSVLAEGVDAATLPAVAAHLRLSQRSLQRHLASEGTSFEAILDELRRELAQRYLSDRKVSISEVAYLLGYSEASAFNRAFKRWTGLTPSQTRSEEAMCGGQRTS